MAKRSFKELLEGLGKGQMDIQEFQFRQGYGSHINPYDLQRLRQLEENIKWHLNQIDTYGKGTIVEITGYIKLMNKRNPTLTTSKPFKILLCGSNIEDAKIYFDFIVKKGYQIDMDRAINFHIIQSGTILT